MELPKVIVTSSRSLYSEYFLHHSCRFISTAFELTLAVIPLLYRIGHCNQNIKFFGSVLFVESWSRSRFLMNEIEKNSKFLRKKCNIFIICPFWRASSYRRSLQLSKENIQHFSLDWKLFIFLSLCLPGSGFTIRIRIHRPSCPDRNPSIQLVTFHTVREKSKYPLKIFVIAMETNWRATFTYLRPKNPRFSSLKLFTRTSTFT